MAIRDIRFSFVASTQALSRDLNRSLYGVAYWFDERLKGRKRKFLSGNEVRGLSIVNLIFCNDPAYHDEVVATIDFIFRYDEPQFLRRGWKANLVDMFSMSRERLSKSRFPQLRWFSQECLGHPEEAEFAAIAPHLIRWQEYMESLSGGRSSDGCSTV